MRKQENNLSSGSALRLAAFSLTALLMLVITVSSALAVSIGASPGIVKADEMLRGGYYERSVTVTTSSERNVGIDAQIMSSEISSWIRLSEDNFTVSKDSPYKTKVIIRPPDDVSNGLYTGNIRLVTTALGGVEGEVGSAVRAAVDLKVEVRITDVEIKKCRAGSFSIHDIEQGSEAQLRFRLMNDGNIRFEPEVEVRIWDQNMTAVKSSFQTHASEIAPSQDRMMIVSVPTSQLQTGQYWAEVSLDECGSNKTVTFDIVEEGAFSSEGNLETILNDIWVDKGDTVPLTAVFHNTGNKSVLAKFVGDVRLGDEVITSIESEELEVPPGEGENFTVYFTPEKEGRYEAHGYVVYNNKKTEERMGVINARGSGNKEDSSGFSPLVLLLAALAVILLLIIIKKKKRAR